MYSLPQLGLLANKLLEKRLNKRGYHQSKVVPGIWKHKWHLAQFTLVMEDFGVKYAGKTCTPPQAKPQRKLHSHNRMGRQKIHRNYTRLVLQAKTSASFTTRPHQEIPQAVQPQKTFKTKPTTPKRPYQVWGQK